MSPSEFYELDTDDYVHVQAGWKNRLMISEGLQRRAAYVIANTIAATNGAKGFDHWFENAWPFGDQKFHENIAETLKRKREKSTKLMAGLSDRLKVHELLNSRKKNGRRSSNTNRR